MNHALLIILGTVAIYMALFVHVAFSPKFSKKLIAAAGAVVVVCGLVFYGFCFAAIYENLILAILKTCHAVCLLFVGESSLDAIAAAPMLQYTLVQVIFSALSFLGIFTTAGAAISAIGANFLRKLRLFLRRKYPVSVIMPLTTQTLELGQELVNHYGELVVFVDKNPDSSCLESARELGCIIRSDEDALSGNMRFMRSLGVNRIDRPLNLYALSEDLFANQQYARSFVKALQQTGLPSLYASLTIFANENETQDFQIYSHGSYTYGNIFCVSQEQLVARLLLHKSPPWKAISFDENALATENFHALMIGCGKVGQVVLKQLVMNSQFSGSQFALTLFDPQFYEHTGQLRYENPELFTRYNITCYPHDARSWQMYQFLEEHVHKLKYVVICTGDDNTNRDIAQQLKRFFQLHGCSLPVHICSRRGLQRITTEGEERWDVYSRQTLGVTEAILINQIYCHNGKSQLENWANCDYFSRMSSCAAADFAPAFLTMTGLSADAIPEKNWCTKAQRENMAITEHARWCAFHFCMGFRAMTQEEFAERCRIYTEEKAKNPDTNYRIGKDLTKRIHACLVPWDALDALSQAENAVTGRNIDYKEMDRANVDALPLLLKSTTEAAE